MHHMVFLVHYLRERMSSSYRTCIYLLCQKICIFEFWSCYIEYSSFSSLVLMVKAIISNNTNTNYDRIHLKFNHQIWTKFLKIQFYSLIATYIISISQFFRSMCKMAIISFTTLSSICFIMFAKLCLIQIW